MSENIMVYLMQGRKIGVSHNLFATSFAQQYYTTATNRRVAKMLRMNALQKKQRKKKEEMIKSFPNDVTVIANGHPMKVQAPNKEGRKHLIHDTLVHNNAISTEDLPKLGTILQNAKFVRKAKLHKEREDNIKRFYYFKTQLHGSIVYLHVAEIDYKTKGGGIGHKRFIYSVKKSRPKSIRKSKQ